MTDGLHQLVGRSPHDANWRLQAPWRVGSDCLDEEEEEVEKERRKGREKGSSERRAGDV